MFISIKSLFCFQLCSTAVLSPFLMLSLFLFFIQCSLSILDTARLEELADIVCISGTWESESGVQVSIGYRVRPALIKQKHIFVKVRSVTDLLLVLLLWQRT